MRMQIEVPDTLWEQFKLIANAKGTSATRAIRELMETYITPPYMRDLPLGPPPLDDPQELPFGETMELPAGVQRGVAGLKRGR